MLTYEEVLSHVKRLKPEEQIRLLETLQEIVFEPVEAEEIEEMISGVEIEES